jgi:hypothetical protein
VPVRSCLVSFTDSRRDRALHPLTAESLYEAAVEAMAAFKNSMLIDTRMPPGARLTIRVKVPEEEHTVTVEKVMAWLEGGGKSPSELVKKTRLRERLRA